MNKKLLDKLYKELNQKEIRLTTDNVNILIDKVRELKEITELHNQKLGEHLKNILEDASKSTEMKKEIQKAYNEAYKLKRSNKRLDFYMGEMMIEILNNFKSNKNFVIDFLLQIQKEQYQLLRDLKHYNFSKSTIRQQLICMHINFGMVQFLVNLMGTYYNNNNLMCTYTLLSLPTDMFVERAQLLTDMYAEWEEENERGC